jgi:superfamily II DNA/RNA helicase
MFTLYKELGLNCLEIHSKKSQMHRFHTYKDFRDSDGSLVMFTSNVSSRGLDYPNITLVIQVKFSAGSTYKCTFFVKVFVFLLSEMQLNNN